jgi:hypothetical protein
MDMREEMVMGNGFAGVVGLRMGVVSGVGGVVVAV